MYIYVHIYIFKMLFKLFQRICTRKRRQDITKYYISRQQYHVKHEDCMTNISVSHMKQIFKQKCLTLTEGYTCFITNCPICNDIKKVSKLYINKTTGFFICDKCKSNGSWDLLQKFLLIQSSDKNTNEFDILRTNCQIEKNFVHTWKNITKRCQNIKELSVEEYQTLLSHFSFPHILQEDMSQLNCFYERTTNVLYFPLVGLNNTVVGYKMFSKKVEQGETIPEFGASGCIKYKQQYSKNDNIAVVVERIDDMLALILKKSANIIICLPYKKSLPQELLPCMESYKKLILWFDNDEKSWYSAKHFAKKFNEKRCYFIRPTDLQPRPKLAAELGYDLKSVIQNARSLWHKSIITFQELREEVLSDLQNNDKVQGIKWKRYSALNRILKGHRRGEFTVLTGPTGSGKTTFMSEYSLDLAMQGVNTLWGSFEIRNVRLAKTMLQQMVRVPLDKNLQNFDSYANTFEKLPIYFMTFHGQQNIQIVMDTVEHATYVHDIAHVVIDNVQFMMGTTESTKHADRFWKQDDIIARFRNFATMYNCHVTMIIHPRKERENEELTTSSIFGSAKASQEADNVLIIQDKRLTSIRGKKYLQVAKNRFSGDLGIMVLDFDKSSLSYSSKMKAKEETNEKETSSLEK